MQLSQPEAGVLTGWSLGDTRAQGMDTANAHQPHPSHHLLYLGQSLGQEQPELEASFPAETTPKLMSPCPGPRLKLAQPNLPRAASPTPPPGQ